MFNNEEYNNQINLFVEEFKTNQGLKRNDFLDISNILLSGGFNIKEFFQQNNYSQNIYGEILKENIEIDLSKINKNKTILHSPNHFAALYKKDDKFYLMDSLSGYVNWKFKNGEVYEVNVPQQNVYTNDCAIYTMVNLNNAEDIIQSKKSSKYFTNTNNGLVNATINIVKQAAKLPFKILYHTINAPFSIVKECFIEDGKKISDIKNLYPKSKILLKNYDQDKNLDLECGNTELSNSFAHRYKKQNKEEKFPLLYK